MFKQRLPGVILLVAAILGLDRGSAQAQFPDAGVLGLADPGSLLARANPQSDILSFAVVANIDLADIVAGEILGATPSAIDRGWSAAIGLNAALSGVESGGSFNLAVQRSSNIVWGAWVRRRSAGSLLVDYAVVGWEGTPGFVVNLSDPGSRIGVAATGTGPFRVANSGGASLMIGGAIFSCELSGALLAGPYEGQLLVTLSVI